MSDLAEDESRVRERMSMIEPDWPEWLFHVQRYAYATTLAEGKRVLDCASGEGYGAELLSRYAAECVGVDIDAMAVADASGRYSSRPNLTFLQGSITNLPFADGSFDLITCFETIEHIGEADQMRAIAEIRRVLVPGGILLLSTPDRLVSEQRGYHNPFHLRELSVADVEVLVAPHFAKKTVLAQELNMMSALSPLAATNSSPSTIAFADLTKDATLTLHPKQDSHFYLLFVLSNEPGVHARAHAFGDYARNPAFQLWNRIDELKREVDACRARHENASTEVDDFRRRYEALQGTLDARNADCDHLRWEHRAAEERNRSLGQLVAELQASLDDRSNLYASAALLESARLEVTSRELAEARACLMEAETRLAECEDRAAREALANKNLAFAVEQLLAKATALEMELATAKAQAAGLELQAADLAGQLKWSDRNNRFLASELMKDQPVVAPSHASRSFADRLHRVMKRLSDKRRWKERRRRMKTRGRRLLKRLFRRTAHDGY